LKRRKTCQRGRGKVRPGRALCRPPAKGEDLDDFPNVIAPRAIERGVAHQQSRPCGGAGVERGAPDVAGLPGAGQRRREPFPGVFSEIASEILQPRIDLAGFDHRAKQRRVGSRKNPRDLGRGVPRRERIERADPVLMLFVHKKPHEVGFVRELVVEGADTHTGRMADVVNARSVTGLGKCDPRGGQKTRPLFLRAALHPPDRFFRQTNNV